MHTDAVYALAGVARKPGRVARRIGGAEKRSV